MRRSNAREGRRRRRLLCRAAGFGSLHLWERPALRAPPIRGRVKSSLSGGDFEENAVMSFEIRDAWSRHCYRVDPEQARTASRWLYLMAWKAAPAKKAVRARRWDYHTCDAGKALISKNSRSYMQIPPPDLGPGARRKTPSCP